MVWVIQMRLLLKRLMIHLLAPAGAFPSAMTDKDALRSFISTLHPMRQDKGLIRLGPPGDGGYLVPDDLAGIEAVFSPGVGNVSGFEKDCADRGMKVHMADNTVEPGASLDHRCHFTKKHIGAVSSAEFISMDDWVDAAALEPNSDLMLQMDIEGYEYEAFLSMSKGLMSRLRIITLEFHRLDQMWNLPFFLLASKAFEKLLQTHTCVHIHPNNTFPPLNKGGLAIPPVAEFTFLRKDRVVNPSPATVFPHPLDQDSCFKPHYPLPECWYKS